MPPILGRNEDDPAVPVTTGQAVRAAAAAAAREVEVEVEIPKPVSHTVNLFLVLPLRLLSSVILHLMLYTFTCRDGETTMCLISLTSSGGENKNNQNICIAYMMVLISTDKNYWTTYCAKIANHTDLSQALLVNILPHALLITHSLSSSPLFSPS